jgi:phage baseplate assembly protein W
LAVSTPHFATPFRLVGGRVAVVEQDSIEEITQCVEACLSTRLGSLVDLPEFGIPDELFKQIPDVDIDAVRAAVEECEPRAALLGVAEFEGMLARVSLRLGQRG